MPKKILQKESLVLRDIAKEVLLTDIGSQKINKIIDEMKESMLSQDDGIAIAAPQIGYPLRIFVVSKRAFEITKKSKKVGVEQGVEEKDLFKDLVYINPIISKLSKEKKILEEGCLSVRYLYGKVKRSNKATVEAYDENGKKFVQGGSGLLAQIFQHEVDHLNGILFIDKAKYIEEIIPPNNKNAQK